MALAGTVTGATAAATIGPSFAVATHTMWWIIAGIGVAIACIGVIASTAAARRSVERVGVPDA